MKKRIFILIFIALSLSSCFNSNTDILLSENDNNISTVSNNEIKTNKEILDDMFQFYCNISNIKNLYSLAPQTEYYKSFAKENDVPSQKIIAPILIAKRYTLGQDTLKESLENNTELYPNTISLLLKSDEKILSNFENIKNVVTVEDFKSNFNTFIEGNELLMSVQDTFSKEYTEDGYDDSGVFLLRGDILCNNNEGLSFWDDRISKINQTNNIISNISYKETATGNKVVITGDINDDNVDKVTVSFSNKSSSFPDDNYILKGYKKGDKSFKYNAFREYEVFDYGLNEYKISVYNGENLLDQETLQLKLDKFTQSEIKNTITIDYNYGYNWAKINNINSFNTCDNKFGSSYGGAEDGCNKYVQENYYNGSTSFGGYECTEDCSGHEAGYEWAEDNDIDDEDDCGGNSNSFIEGCIQYVEDNY